MSDFFKYNLTKSNMTISNLNIWSNRTFCKIVQRLGKKSKMFIQTNDISNFANYIVSIIVLK